MAVSRHTEELLPPIGTDFTLKIYPALLEAIGKKRNFVASPFSLSSVLTMVYFGAKGATADQVF